MPGTDTLGELFGLYAAVSTLVIPLALGTGLDERSASAVSITTGIAAVSLFVAWRYLLPLHDLVADSF